MNNDIKAKLEAAGIKCLVIDRLDEWCDNYEITDGNGNITDSVPQYWHITGLLVASNDFDAAVKVLRETMWEDLDAEDYRKRFVDTWNLHVDGDDIPLDCVVTWHINGEDRDLEHSIDGSGHYYIGYCA